jgi:hypothetical protein
MASLWDQLTKGSTISTPTSTITSAQLPDWAANIQRNILESAAKAVPEYEYYDPARRIAPLSETERQAINLTPEAAFAYQPGLAAGMGSAYMGTRGLGEVDLSQYMNPYTQNVTDITKREAIRDYEKMRPQIGFQAAQRGAFGGARHGVVEAEAERNLGQRLSDIEATGQEKAYKAATDLFGEEAKRQLLGADLFRQLGMGAQGMGLQGLQAVLGAQGLPRQVEQQQRDLAFQEYMRQQGYDLGNIERLGNIFRGVAPAATTTQTGQTITPQTSTLATLAGAGATGLGLYKMFGGSGGGGGGGGGGSAPSAPSNLWSDLGNAANSAYNYLKFW